jgi:hypothetical protein
MKRGRRQWLRAALPHPPLSGSYSKMKGKPLMPTDSLIEWCQQQRAALSYQLKSMRAGVLKVTEHRGIVPTDVSPEYIARIEAQIATMDEIISRRSPKS